MGYSVAFLLVMLVDYMALKVVTWLVLERIFDCEFEFCFGKKLEIEVSMHLSWRFN